MQRMWSSRAAPDGDRRPTATSTSTPCWRRSASTTSRPAASPRGSRAAFRGGDDEEQLPATVLRPRGHRAHADRSASTSRASTTCSCGSSQLLHAGARRRDHRLRHPRPRRQRAPRRLRQRRVADERPGDAADRRRLGRRAAARPSFRAGVEVVALDRSRLLRDVANALGDHHVNIVACEHRTPATTASPRCASSSSWPTPATSTPVLRTIKTDRRRLRRLPPGARAARRR